MQTLFSVHTKSISIILKVGKGGTGKGISGKKKGFSELIIMVKFSSHCFS